ncbi:DUF1707 domain-containing protein [Actinophytocola sp.]|uniref:DUF1707 SHOCT-like domain-containing protein n=1 Tax=Actinophytocola sp. TaxID=1872138 RepID=UPI002D7F2E72|nr:DUF1707 domain-containing protein [Actinophytocola sp.]HET9142762.1 DUF1707 domain-containing protein [Actinophytocola sp.]
MTEESSLGIRIGDADRHDARELFDVHLEEGRLTPAEHEHRITLAGHAVTRGDLAKLFADLPAPHPDYEDRPPPGTGLLETPWSSALEFAAGATFLFGMPTALLLTIFKGWWWLLIVFLVAGTVLGMLSAAAKKPREPG